jgi:hypothetical protein
MSRLVALIRSFSPRVKLALYFGFLVGLTVAGGAVIHVFHLHNLMKQSRWPIGAHQYNAAQGYELTPSFDAPLLNKSFHTRSHDLGFRIPRGQSASEVEPGGVLAVGCSFTYGDGVEGEETFSYRLGELLDVPTYNFGVCSYSYASVILQLRDLESRGILSRLKPKFLVLGAGSWLRKRSVTTYSATAGLHFSYPYLRPEGEAWRIARPPEWMDSRHTFGFDVEYFPSGSRDGKLTVTRFFKLLAKVPRLWVAGTLGRTYYKVLRVMGLPETNESFYTFVLHSLRETWSKYGMTPVVIWMPLSEDDTVDADLLTAAKAFPELVVVDGIATLKDGNVEPVEYAGRHPSRKTHDVYARAIAEALQRRLTSRNPNGAKSEPASQ